ncbi:MAG TPA: shikimate dehydrogenase [Caulobacteraceae bacterium]
MKITAATRLAGVVGRPIRQSLSPAIHNAWLGAAGIDAVYLAFEPDGLSELVSALRARLVLGLNVTAPFKAEALASADVASARAERAGAANLLTLDGDGAVLADNTDGEGLLAAFAEQAPGYTPQDGPAAIIGAGGAAAGAALALLEAGAPQVRILNRSPARAADLASYFGERVSAHDLGESDAALDGAVAIVNATAVDPAVSLAAAAPNAIVLDMAYRPVLTPFLRRARARGLATVDGLAMLIGQARPSFSALFGVEVPDIDVRAVAIAAMSVP